MRNSTDKVRTHKQSISQKRYYTYSNTLIIVIHLRGNNNAI